MQEDPIRYWQDLTENYRRMSDGEILELARKPDDLTEVAQQVLRDEMRLRGLTATRSGRESPRVRNAGAAIHREPMSYRYEFAPAEPDKSNGPHEYTWKTRLCDCETRQQAWQLAEALRRAGIDSWIQATPTKSEALDLTYPRILVAADQLDEAQAIAAQPIPHDIIDVSEEDEESEPRYFEVPVCPKCGAPDPVLCPAGESEASDPKPDDKKWVNSWLCEACGAEWTDSEETSEGNPPVSNS